MIVLSVVNVGEPCGGTLRCALDMIAALPDCEHTVHVLQKNLSDEARETIEPLAQVVFGKDVPEAGSFDLVLCHNTPLDKIPFSPGRVIYYAHSVNSTAKALPDRVDARLCVSRWLAGRLGWDPVDVLYQPTAVPPAGGKPRGDGITIGRICTPIPKKWRRHEWVPYFVAASNAFPEARISLVGVSDRDFDSLPFRGRATPYRASPEARSLLHEWDILLYTSGVEESFGRVVREAQRCGCYPIVSRRGGFVEQIEGGCGFLVSDPNEVTDAISQWLPNRQKLSFLCKEHGDRTGSLQAWRNGFLHFLSKL